MWGLRFKLRNCICSLISKVTAMGKTLEMNYMNNFHQLGSRFYKTILPSNKKDAQDTSNSKHKSTYCSNGYAWKFRKQKYVTHSEQHNQEWKGGCFIVAIGYRTYYKTSQH